LERKGKPIRVYAFQHVGIGKDSGKRWLLSTRRYRE
jgi:hypothetical protein